MLNAPIEVTIQSVDGSSTKVQVERGTTAAMILRQEAIECPAGYQARLVTESAQAVAGLRLGARKEQETPIFVHHTIPVLWAFLKVSPIESPRRTTPIPL